jgi:hypothetical protein
MKADFAGSQFPEEEGVDGSRNVGLFTINPLKTKRICFKDSVRTAQYTLCISVIKNNLLMSYKAKVADCFEIHTKHIDSM